MAKDNYFIVAGSIWEEYFENKREPTWGGMGIQRRDEALAYLREQLVEKSEAKPVEVKRPPSKAEMRRFVEERIAKVGVTYAQPLRSGRDPVARMVAAMDFLKED